MPTSPFSPSASARARVYETRNDPATAAKANASATSLPSRWKTSAIAPEHEALADPIGRRVEERAERRPLAAQPRESAVEDVQDRPDHEDDGAGPEEEDLVAVLEVDEHRTTIAQSVTPEAVSAFGVTRERARPDIDRVASARPCTV